MECMLVCMQEQAQTIVIGSFTQDDSEEKTQILLFVSSTNHRFTNEIARLLI
jgi:hypothetical protein